MKIVVQAISTYWSKHSRGAPMSSRRTLVPVALTLPIASIRDSESACVLDQITYGERDGFQHPHRLPVAELTSKKLGEVFYQVDENIVVVPVADYLRVDLQWAFGAPIRRQRIGLLTLKPESWGRVSYNYRSTNADGQWIYVQRTLNIFHGEKPDPDIFVTSEPSISHVDLANLW